MTDARMKIFATEERIFQNENIPLQHQTGSGTEVSIMGLLRSSGTNVWLGIVDYT